MSSIVGNKNLYKIFLIIIKYIPIVLAVCKVITLITHYFKFRIFILTCVGGTSLIMLLLLYLISYIFKFCLTHRLPLHYVTTISVLTMLDYYFGSKISVITSYRIYAILTGIFIITWILVWFVNRKNPKIDHIKQLCENYSNCCK